MSQNTSFLKFVLENDPTTIFQSSASFMAGKIIHSLNVEKIGMELLQTNFAGAKIDKSLLRICLRLHDIGRKEQFDKTKSFDDTLIDHHAAGAYMVKQAATDNDKCWQMLYDCCLYHGWPDKAPELSRPYVEIVTIADRIENGCISAVGYLEKEKETDNKGYIRRNKTADQSICNDAVMKFVEANELFDKYKYCKTYADYFAFAAMLMISLCDNTLARKYANEPNNDSIIPSKEMQRICRDNICPEQAKIICQKISKIQSAYNTSSRKSNP